MKLGKLYLQIRKTLKNLKVASPGSDTQSGYNSSGRAVSGMARQSPRKMLSTVNFFLIQLGVKYVLYPKGDLGSDLVLLEITGRR